MISPSLSYESRGGEDLPFKIDLRGIGVGGLGVDVRGTKLRDERDGFSNVDDRCSALLKDRGDMSDGDSGSVLWGILGVFRRALGLPRLCFVLNMKGRYGKRRKRGDVLVEDLQTGNRKGWRFMQRVITMC